jgi:hypothetical protein
MLVTHSATAVAVTPISAPAAVTPIESMLERRNHLEKARLVERAELRAKNWGTEAEYEIYETHAVAVEDLEREIMKSPATCLTDLVLQARLAMKETKDGFGCECETAIRFANSVLTGLIAFAATHPHQVGMRVKTARSIEELSGATIQCGEMGTVVERNSRTKEMFVRMDTRHPELDEMENCGLLYPGHLAPDLARCDEGRQLVWWAGDQVVLDGEIVLGPDLKISCGETGRFLWGDSSNGDMMILLDRLCPELSEWNNCFMLPPSHHHYLSNLSQSGARSPEEIEKRAAAGFQGEHGPRAVKFT